MQQHTQRGFTLIELLVVVLIIAILSAVALPQYQKSVVRSRYASLKNLTHSIANAQELYYLANGTYADDFEKLDISMPGNVKQKTKPYKYTYDWGYCETYDMGTNGSLFAASCTNDNAKMSYQIFLKRSSLPDLRRCIAWTNNENSSQNQICKQETGASSGSPVSTYWVWLYN